LILPREGGLPLNLLSSSSSGSFFSFLKKKGVEHRPSEWDNVRVIDRDNSAILTAP